MSVRRVVTAHHRRAGLLALLLAAFLAAAVPAFYVASGGTRYRPARAANSCAAAAARSTASTEDALAAVGLDAVRRASCALGVPRAELTLALLDGSGLDAAAARTGVSRGALERAVRDGAIGALADAGRRRVVDASLLPVLTAAVRILPAARLIGALGGPLGPCVADRLTPSGKLADDLSTIAVVTVDRAACALEVGPAALAVGLTSEADLARFEQTSGLSRATVESAFLDAATRTLDDARGARLLSATVLDLLQTAVRVVPLSRVAATIGGSWDPCQASAWVPVKGTQNVLAESGLVALDSAACVLRVGPEQLALALQSDADLARFERERRLEPSRVDAAVRDGAQTALADAERRGDLQGPVVVAIRTALRTLTLPRLVAAIGGTLDPCVVDPWVNTDGQQSLLAEVALVAVERASCTLRVQPRDLATALATDEDLRRFEEARGISHDAVQRALREGVNAGLDNADHAGDVNGVEGFLLRQAVQRLSLDRVLQLVRSGSLSL